MGDVCARVHVFSDQSSPVFMFGDNNFYQFDYAHCCIKEFIQELLMQSRVNAAYNDQYLYIALSNR